MSINLSFTPLMEVDLRDTGGHKLAILTVTELSGTYEQGGVVIDPEEVGFNTIEYMAIQTNVSVPLAEMGGEGDEWILVMTTSLMTIVDSETGELTWRWIFHQGGIENGTPLAEFPNGAPFMMPSNYAPVLVVVGS